MSNTDVNVRRAVDDDAEMVFRWRNTPAIRDLGTLQRDVTHEEHVAWFHESVRSPSRRLFIIEERGTPVGQLRFDKKSDARWDVSIYLLPGCTGRGIGTRMLREGCADLFASTNADLVVAFIRSDNAPSLKSFARAGFTLDVNGIESVPADHRVAALRKTSESGAQERIGHFYDALVDKYGDDARAADYGRRESQLAKYRVLAEVLPSFAGKRVLDVGCGTGDYAGFLRAKSGDVKYTGTDLSLRMVELAKHKLPGDDIRHGDFTTMGLAHDFDVVTANGIFYLLGDGALAKMRDIVRAMWAHAKEAVAFTSLSSWAADPAPDEFYADPAATIDFCRTLTPFVVLRHDYHTRDFAVFMYRERR